jgi:hypothetical protein
MSWRAHRSVRERRQRASWLRVWQAVAAVTLLLALRALRLHPLLDAAAPRPLALPARWPACAHERAGAPPLEERAALQPEPAARGAAGVRYAILSTWLPTRRGIATFSAGLRAGLLASGAADVDVLAVHLRSNGALSYGPEARARHAAFLPARARARARTRARCACTWPPQRR